ncbi:putative transposase, Tnp1/En/Spm [Helianthus annuus]|nr:putative transposase, Tnp1/En/Spm [Helianthus annuus]
MNAYEKSRMTRIQENQKKIQALRLKNIAKSLTSLAEREKIKKKKKKSMDTSEKDIDVEYMPGSDVDVEQDYQEATKISKKKQRPTYIAPQSLKRYKRKLFAVDNDDDHRERDMRFHDINEEQDDVEFDDMEDIDMNEAYEEQDSFKDDGDKDMEDLEKVNDLENQNDELVEEECEVLENEEEHEVSQQENEAVRNVRKRVRGPTHMPRVWPQEKGDRIPILVNAHGQLINDKSSQLTHFMGTLSRSGKYCPIYKPWNKVNAAKKQALLALLKVKSWRARVKELYHGLGVRAADVWGVIPSRSACHRENIQLKSQCEELTSTVVQLRTQVSEMEGSRGGSSVQPLASQHFPNVTNGHQRLRVGDEVFLKSILNSTEIVARGRVQSLDPNDVVGGTKIGPEWCEVNVQLPIKKDENLVRPYGLFSTIQDCIGTSIAWPYPFISVVHED